MTNDRLEKYNQAEVRFLKTTWVRVTADCWAWLFTSTVFNPSQNHLTPHVCNKAIYCTELSYQELCGFSMHVIYISLSFKTTCFCTFISEGAVLYSSRSRSTLKYWCLKNRIYRDLGSQTPIKMDLTQILWHLVSYLELSTERKV